MKIEKINDDKIRITLNIDDLKEKNIDFHSFMANPIESQDLFLDMLETAEKEVGFVTKNYKIILDALFTSEGNFILTVTRDSCNLPKKKIAVRRKSSILNNSIAIYSFAQFEDVISFCKYIYPLQNKHKLYVSKNTSLIEFQDNYYMVFRSIKNNPQKLKLFGTTISEFGTYIQNSDLFERKLLEYGKKIIGSNAINTINKSF